MKDIDDKDQSFEAKIAGLKTLQDIISRLSEKSKQMKIWGVSITSGLSTYFIVSTKNISMCNSNDYSTMVTNFSWKFLLITIITCLILASFNAYYLSLSRKFITIYNELCTKKEFSGVNFFDIKSKLDTQQKIYKGSWHRNTWHRCLCSKSVSLFYISLQAIFFIIIYIGSYK